MQHISLTPDEELNSLMYGTFSDVNRYGSYTFKKNSPFFDAPCIF